MLSIDVGGSHVKVMLNGVDERRRFQSGPDLTPTQMVDGVLAITSDWNVEVVSVGVPAPTAGDRVTREPVNLGADGWDSISPRRSVARRS